MLVRATISEGREVIERKVLIAIQFHLIYGDKALSESQRYKPPRLPLRPSGANHKLRPRMMIAIC